MSLSEQLERKLHEAENYAGLALSGPLADAERMADEFSEIKPIPYIVPIEIYIGVSFQSDKGSA